jgi:hypothetical protein
MPQLIAVVVGALFIFALVDIILSDSSQVRHLPKVTWVFVVIFLPLIGSIIWIAVGKDRFSQPAYIPLGDRRRWEQPDEPEPLDDAAAIDREIEFYENEARIRRLEAELKAKREKN